MSIADRTVGWTHAIAPRLVRSASRSPRAGLRLVYGGSHLGLTGELADAVLMQGGEVTGIVPELW